MGEVPSERMSPRASDGYYAVIRQKDGSGLYLTLGWFHVLGEGFLVTLKEDLLKQKTEIARNIVVSEHIDLKFC